MPSYRLNTVIVQDLPELTKVHKDLEAYGRPENGERGVLNVLLGADRLDVRMYRKIGKEMCQVNDLGQVDTFQATGVVPISLALWPCKGLMELYSGGGAEVKAAVAMLSTDLQYPIRAESPSLDLKAAVASLSRQPGFKVLRMSCHEHPWKNPSTKGNYVPVFAGEEDAQEFLEGEDAERAVDVAVSFKLERKRVRMTLRANGQIAWSCREEHRHAMLDHARACLRCRDEHVTVEVKLSRILNLPDKEKS